MYVESVTTADALADLASDWNALSRGVPFRSFDWLETWWRHYGAREASATTLRRLQVLVVRDHNQVVGIAPWFVETSLGQGRLLKFLGTGEVYSDYLSILAVRGCEAAVAARIGHWLLDVAGGMWDALELTGIDGDDHTTVCLLTELERRGVRILRRPELHCWRITLPSNWEEYLGQLSKSHRKQIRRVERRLQNEGALRTWRAQSTNELARASQLLVDLHQQRHRLLGRPGAFASSAFTNFQTEVLPRLARTGQLRLDVLELQGVPIAVEYQVTGTDVVYAYQAGIDPHYLRLEPGRASMAIAIRDAIESGFRAFDLLRGDEPYKLHWRATPRPTLRARAVATHRSARLRGAVWLAQDHAREWFKQALRSDSASLTST
jgi:CelD/BcsL family acetyltransferase involved in cellulose biosynthesis